MSYYESGRDGHYKPAKGFSARICPGCRCKKRCKSCNERPVEQPVERPVERPIRPIIDLSDLIKTEEK
ncbi:hypothetical protein [Shouchella lehensis]|uniref:Uncharacterized protein n=1 Tax=Shouchella lehensis TaxID=300825 RepID=A0A4Y7WNK2_9BACI|nr:hypothetical protein [Shouchella lehensis]MBG9782786.1 hypothetical protein [Shouchella lehensis]RQW23050.1 hypothetical protein EH196_04380 [Bacillus sp. C1-1]TES49874.1 hypothetical protein E2L03_10540 [Shouchella lehensis]